MVKYLGLIINLKERYWENKYLTLFQKIQTGIDLIVLAVPADVTVSYLDEINARGIKNIVIYSAGFKETGTLGLKREKTLIKKAKEYEMNILGPNCLGYIATENNINLTFLKQSCPKRKYRLYFTIRSIRKYAC